MSVVVVVLTIAGLSFNLLSQHHFEVLDRQALVEKLESTKKIFNNVRSSANLAEELPQLRALLGAHHDLAATILSEDGRVLFSDPKTVDVPESYRDAEQQNINPAIKYTKSCCVGDTWMPEIRTDSLRA